MFGYVFYPDGGCRPQHEYSGAGIHGYRWNLDLTPKGIGHTVQSATFNGYVVKAESFDFPNKEMKSEINDLPRDGFQQWLFEDSTRISYRVPVEAYYDSFIPLDFGGTNNSAELYGAIHTLERIITEPNFKDAALVVIRQDSRYVVDGCNMHYERWAEKGFLRPDGTKRPNEDLWHRFMATLQAIRDLGVMVKLEWVGAHGTDLGNNTADLLATAGVFKSRIPKEVEKLDSSFRISEATGYWGTNSGSRHPMLNLRYLYASVIEANDPRREYYLCSQGKLPELTGKKTSDDGYAVIRCGADPFLESIIKHQATLPREVDYRFSLDLDSAYGEGGRYLGIYGTDFLYRMLPHSRSLFTLSEVPLTAEYNPPYLVDRVFDNTDILADLLDNYESPNQPTLHVTEITDTFYNRGSVDVKVKKGEEAATKEVTELKADITVGYSKHQVVVAYKDSEGEIIDIPLTLRVGIDLPDRNTLKRLEEGHPHVFLVTNTIGPGSFMYAVVIKAGNDSGIWSGINSSIRVIAKTAARAAKPSKLATAAEATAGTDTSKVVTMATLATAKKISG